MSGPVQRAQQSAGGNHRISAPKLAAADTVRDEEPDAALVAIALGNDGRAEPRRQRIDLEVRGRSIEIGDEAEHMRDREIVKAVRQRAAVPSSGRQCVEQPIERSVLTEEQDFVLAAEVVIQIAWRQIRGGGDVAHAGGGKAAGAEDAGGGSQDVHAPRVGAASRAGRRE